MLDDWWAAMRRASCLLILVAAGTFTNRSANDSIADRFVLHESLGQTWRNERVRFELTPRQAREHEKNSQPPRVSTSMIYTQVLNKGDRAVRSPAGSLALFSARYSRQDIPPTQRDILSTPQERKPS